MSFGAITSRLQRNAGSTDTPGASRDVRPRPEVASLAAQDEVMLRSGWTAWRPQNIFMLWPSSQSTPIMTGTTETEALSIMRVLYERTDTQPMRWLVMESFFDPSTAEAEADMAGRTL